MGKEDYSLHKVDFCFTSVLKGVKNQEWMNVVDKMNDLSKYEIAYS